MLLLTNDELIHNEVIIIILLLPLFTVDNNASVLQCARLKSRSDYTQLSHRTLYLQVIGTLTANKYIYKCIRHQSRRVRCQCYWYLSSSALCKCT